MNYADCYASFHSNFVHVIIGREIFIIAFTTSYLVKREFGAMLQLLMKQRNRLDITKKGDLRLLLTDIEPQIELLMAEHQAQASHWV